MRISFSLLLGAMIILGMADVISDSRLTGWSLHTSIEAALLLAAAIGLVLLWRGLGQRLQRLQARADVVEQELAAFRQRNAATLGAMRTAVHDQFSRWELSPAERRTAEALIRGYSLKEIAAASGKSEKTVRNQSTEVYRKASMTGRADLAAFFLNDVLGEDEGAAHESS